MASLFLSFCILVLECIEPPLFSAFGGSSDHSSVFVQFDVTYAWRFCECYSVTKASVHVLV